jgi:hypothetical protein
MLNKNVKKKNFWQEFVMYLEEEFIKNKNPIAYPFGYHGKTN